MSVVLGLDAVLYRGTAGQQGSTEVTNVKDLTLNLESGEADVTTRKTQGWKASIATLKEGSLEFEMLYDTADADFQAFQAAYFGNTPIALFVSDGAGTGVDRNLNSRGDVRTIPPKPPPHASDASATCGGFFPFDSNIYNGDRA